MIRLAFVDGQDRSVDVARWLTESENSADDLPSGYEAAVVAADDIADKRFDKAEAVAKREQLHEQIHQIRRLKKQGMNTKKLAEMFGVCADTIRVYCRKKK